MAKARPWSCSGPRYWYSDPLAEKTLIRNGPKSPDPVMPPPTIFSTSSDWKRRAPTQEKISAPSETVTSNLNRSVQNSVICGSIFGSCTSAQLLTRTAGIASNLDRRTGLDARVLRQSLDILDDFRAVLMFLRGGMASPAHGERGIR